MVINRGIKFRIYPDSKQQELLKKFFGCARYVWNYGIEMERRNHEAGGKFIRYETLAKDLPALKKEHPFLAEADSTSLQQALKQLHQAYVGFFKRLEEEQKKPKEKRGPVSPPGFRSAKSGYQSYTGNCVSDNVRIEGRKLRLPKVGEVRIVVHREIPSDWQLKSVTVKKIPSGKYYAVLHYRFEKQETVKKTETAIGLDFAMRGLYVDSDGHRLDYPMFFRKSEEKLAREQRKLSRMNEGSSNYKKQHLRIAKIQEKIANQRADLLHKLSHDLAERYDAVCIEDLDLKETAKDARFSKTLYDEGWGMFIRILSYKLEERGGKLIKTDRYFPSSQLCSICGYRNEETKDLSLRWWTCPECGAQHDRDHNAAVNIKNEGLKHLS